MEWISIENSLPKVGQVVLIANRSQVKIGWLEEMPKGKYVEWYTCDDSICKITHWMPLPLPPSQNEGILESEYGASDLLRAKPNLFKD